MKDIEQYFPVYYAVQGGSYLTILFGDNVCLLIERMQPIPRDSNDNGVVTMLVYRNKPSQ